MARVVIPAAGSLSGTDKVLVRIGSEGIIREIPVSALIGSTDSRLAALENQWFPVVNANDAVAGVIKIGGTAKDFKPLVGNFKISSAANASEITPFVASGSGFELSSSITVPAGSVPKTVKVTKAFPSGGAVSGETQLVNLGVSCTAGSTIIILATARSYISWGNTNPQSTSLSWMIERYVSALSRTALTDWHSVCGWGTGISTVNDWAISIGTAMTAYYTPSATASYTFRLLGKRDYGNGSCFSDNIKFTVLEIQ